ncbi:CIA30 family protein [Desulfobacula sp.]|uniref:CIA30 family protein n=1 Tax=Desulfobacula sp. TaxID=2593537 RepID=UPI002636D615|nr:CIA30 family protein [Desulfobacula sp.]
MKPVRIQFILMVVSLLFLLSEARANETYNVINKAEKLIFDFKNTDEIKNWQIVNDGVMGGLSESEIVFRNNLIIFKGIVSLENNGGFASMRTLPRSYELDGYNGILLRVKGDGKKYQFRIRTNDRFDGISYRYQFETQPNTWTIVSVPFHECVPVFRGRILENLKPLHPEKIQQIGFLISNKKAEKFQLEIDWIRSYK